MSCFPQQQYGSSSCIHMFLDEADWHIYNDAYFKRCDLELSFRSSFKGKIVSSILLDACLSIDVALTAYDCRLRD